MRRNLYAAAVLVAPLKREDCEPYPEFVLTWNGRPDVDEPLCILTDTQLRTLIRDAQEALCRARREARHQTGG